MSPVEDDPAVWAAMCKFFRQIADGLSFTTPFVGPAFLGAVCNAIWRKHFRKGVIYLASAVLSSTLAGSVLTPLFAHVAGFPDNVTGSTAAFVAILGYEAINKFTGKDKWDGGERRQQPRDE